VNICSNIFKYNCQIIQIALNGDAGAIMGQLLEQSRASGLKYGDDLQWWSALKAKCDTNKQYNLVIVLISITNYSFA